MGLDLYDRLRDASVIVDRGVGLVRVEGPDRVSWLQGMVTNDVGRLEPGQGCYAAYLSPQGKVVSLMAVLADADALWLALEAENAARTVAELDKLLIMEDASISECSSEFRTLSLIGAGARGLLEGLGFDTPALGSDYAHTEREGCRCMRAAVGYDLFAPPADADRLEAHLIREGALAGDASLWKAIRIEAGLPLYGVDVDERTTFPELGEKGIDYEKGCYIGQEVVAKIKYIGHVNRSFVGLKLEGSVVPSADATVRVEGRDAGRITSAVRSPGLDAVIALAFLRRGSDKPGKEVEVSVESGSCRGIVIELPFLTHAS